MSLLRSAAFSACMKDMNVQLASPSVETMPQTTVEPIESGDVQVTEDTYGRGFHQGTRIMSGLQLTKRRKKRHLQPRAHVRKDELLAPLGLGEGALTVDHSLHR